MVIILIGFDFIFPGAGRRFDRPEQTTALTGGIMNEF
jgi:hypothetical protein